MQGSGCGGFSFNFFGDTNTDSQQDTSSGGANQHDEQRAPTPAAQELQGEHVATVCPLRRAVYMRECVLIKLSIRDCDRPGDHSTSPPIHPSTPPTTTTLLTMSRSRHHVHLLRQCQ